MFPRDGKGLVAMPEDSFCVNIAARHEQLKRDAGALQPALEAQQPCDAEEGTLSAKARTDRAKKIPCIVMRAWLQPNSMAAWGAQETGAPVLVREAAQHFIQVIFSLRSPAPVYADLLLCLVEHEVLEI